VEEKYIYGLSGMLLVAALSYARDLLTENRTRKKEAEYLAIRMICIFDVFVEGCASVVADDGLYHGQPDQDGYSRVQVTPPTIDISIDDVNWKSLSAPLMYEILLFPSLINDANSYISAVFEHACPPGYGEGFEERQNQYSLLGIMANEISKKLREKYSLPPREISSWDVVEFLNDKQNSILKIRKEREAQHLKSIK
jgi:hypothetical protein